MSVCLCVTFCLSLNCKSWIRISIQFELSARGEKRDAGKRPNVLAWNASWPDNPRSAAHRAAQDLVCINSFSSTMMQYVECMNESCILELMPTWNCFSSTKLHRAVREGGQAGWGDLRLWGCSPQFAYFVQEGLSPQGLVVARFSESPSCKVVKLSNYSYSDKRLRQPETLRPRIPGPIKVAPVVAGLPCWLDLSWELSMQIIRWRAEGWELLMQIIRRRAESFFF